MVLDDKGLPLRHFADRRGVWRYPVSLDQVSENYLQALLHYEDRYFYSHPGVNPFALARAFFLNLRSGKTISGGSTISMQVARLIRPHSKSYGGKLQQIFTALQLEWRFDKKDILSYYINHAPFGGNIEGVQAAALTYLERSASELSDGEAALLAVLPQAPSRYRPDRHKLRAINARNKVLARLSSHKGWSADRINSAIKEELHANRIKGKAVASLFCERVKSTSGPATRTFIDRDLQIDAERALQHYVMSLGTGVSAAALILDDANRVIAYAGSADYANTDRFGYVDMVRAIRSPGSALKPFLYGLAIDEGLIHDQSLMSDVPTRFNDYAPVNFDGQFQGALSARRALVESSNIPAVQLLQAYQPKRFHSVLTSAKVNYELPYSARPNLSMILGGLGMSLEELTRLYTTLAVRPQQMRGKLAPIQLTDSAYKNPKAFGNDQKPSITPPVTRDFLSANSSWLISDMLQEQSREAWRHKMLLSRKDPLVLKTGTSYGFRDAWAIGTLGQYTLGVWIGRPDGTSLVGNTGRLRSVPLAKQLARSITLHRKVIAIEPQPKSVVTATICWPQGLQEQLAGSGCHVKKQAKLVNGFAPATLGDPEQSRFANTHHAHWPYALRPYLPLAWKQFAHVSYSASYKVESVEGEDRISEPALFASSSPTSSALTSGHAVIKSLKIKSPRHKDKLASLAHLSNLPPLIVETNEKNFSGRFFWFLNGEFLHQTSYGETRINLPEPGSYRLGVKDHLGRSDTITITRL